MIYSEFKNINKKYDIIYADPPWLYKDKLGTNSAKMGGYDKYYKGMSLNEICELNVKDITNKDCILFLWITMPKLNECFKVIDSWGFKYKTCAFSWIKLNPKSKTIFKGVGRWVMGNNELCLLATKGKPKRITKNISQIVLAKRGKHSEKPEEVRKRIELLMGNNLNKIELFSRKEVDGWDCFGNQIEKKKDFGVN